jgi:hypothetical protein
MTENEVFETEKLWGGNLKYPIKSRKLDKDACSLAIYLQDALHLTFPMSEKPLYPTFYVKVREVLNLIVRRSFETQSQVSNEEAIEILTSNWNSEEFQIDKDHIHHNLYWNLAQTYVKSFANTFIPESGNAGFIELFVGKDEDRKVELDLICAYTINGFSPKAIFFQAESLEDKLSTQGLLLWGGIKVRHRNSFILLGEDFSGLQIKVFSGNDGILRNFQWGSVKNVDTQKERIKEKYEQLSNERFVGTVVEDTCNRRCANRINCPHWIGALK